MEFNSLLNSRSKKEQYMIFMGSFLVIFYLFYLSWGYFDKLYFKALMRYENELNSYISTNLPTQIQNQIELADKKLQNNKTELNQLKIENEFLQTHAINLANQISKFSSNSEILAFIDNKSNASGIKISKILPNQISNDRLYDYNISFSSTFDLALRFIDELEGAWLEISQARFEPYNSEIRLILRDFR
ncbi:hypothetical protein [Campylobacter lanienae]|uniref:hypothetical protein n=1 Tax=Campylobacter lanienae TaxID=75658 RepID=UPI000BB3FC7D|nr:hypothetical protein [Campylobacter lanienae]